MVNFSQVLRSIVASKQYEVYKQELFIKLFRTFGLSINNNHYASLTSSLYLSIDLIEHRLKVIDIQLIVIVIGVVVTELEVNFLIVFSTEGIGLVNLGALWQLSNVLKRSGLI